MDSLSLQWLYSKCMSSCGGIGSPWGCSWGIKRLGAAAHPVEGSGLRCAAACLDFNWLWWQWVACRYWAECWSGVSPKQPRPVILPVILKVSTVAQHGRRSSSQPFAMAHRCTTAICGWDRRFWGGGGNGRKWVWSRVPCWFKPPVHISLVFHYKKFFDSSLTGPVRIVELSLPAKWIRGGALAMELAAVHWWMWTATRTKWLDN